MTNEEAEEVLAMYRFKLIQSISNQLEGDIEAFDVAIKALEQQPCEDAISRAALLEELGEEPFNWNDSPEEFQEVRDYQWFKSLVENAPSVTPKQKAGKWIPHIVNDKYESIDRDVCSECHTCFYGERTGDWKYCPNCGSDNRDLESLGESFADGFVDGLEEK